MVIDSHHHFWKYNKHDFGWINDEMSVIRRDFLPEDLKQTISAAGVDGVISVQARQSLKETDWLLRLARENDFILGVTGWLPLSDDDAEEHLEKYAAKEKLKAVRHVVQDEEDDYFILRKDFNRGISLLKNYGLIYEILIFEKHLPQTIDFVDRHQDQIFVLDHIAKPLIKDNIIYPWKKNITELAKRPNVFCKVSGMVTEADFKTWTPEQLRPYFNVVLEAFGPERLMFGSDWPVCLAAAGYDDWLKTVKGGISGLSEDEQEMILGGTAQRVYGL
jgi:L-fuconolactonase